MYQIYKKIFSGFFDSCTRFRVIAMAPIALKLLEYQARLNLPVVLAYDTTFNQTQHYWESILSLVCVSLTSTTRVRLKSFWLI
jgi:hypothetical protein